MFIQLYTKIPHLINGKRRKKHEDMTMLLDDDVIDIDHLEAETNECEGSGRERRGSGNQGSGNELSASNSGKIKIVSRKFVWNYLVDYFCPSWGFYNVDLLDKDEDNKGQLITILGKEFQKRSGGFKVAE